MRRRRKNSEIRPVPTRPEVIGSGVVGDNPVRVAPTRPVLPPKPWTSAANWTGEAAPSVSKKEAGVKPVAVTSNFSGGASDC